MAALRSALIGFGAAAGSEIVESSAIEARLGLEDGWIERRSGIRRRPIVSAEEATSDLAVRAGAAALQSAEVSPLAVDLVLLATSTPDHPLPPTAPAVADRLGCHNAGACDLAAACAGFLYALRLADGPVRHDGQTVLVIGANVLSRRLDPDDASVQALFADGAGAVLLAPSDEDRGLKDSVVGADGSRASDIMVQAGGSRQPLDPEGHARGEHLMSMRKGRRVYRKAVEAMDHASREVLAKSAWSVDDIDWWIPHQANQRILTEAGRRLGMPPERTIMTIAELGNSSAATIPQALSIAWEDGRLKRGQRILMTAVGAGLVWAATTATL